MPWVGTTDLTGRGEFQRRSDQHICHVSLLTSTCDAGQERLCAFVRKTSLHVKKNGTRTI